MTISVVLMLVTAAMAFAWLAAVPMPEGTTKKALVRVVDRLSSAYVFGGLIGAVYGAAECAPITSRRRAVPNTSASMPWSGWSYGRSARWP